MAGGRHHVVSVVLGSDAIEYQSSSAAMNQHVGEKPAGTSKKATENLNKECHVQFGEPGTKRNFTTSSKLADPTGEVLKYRGELAAEAMDMLTRTSSCYGNDVVTYISSTQLATQWDKKAVAETVKLRNEIRARTGPRPTRGMSYDEEVEYISEAKSAYKNKFKIHKPSIMAASVKNVSPLFLAKASKPSTPSQLDVETLTTATAALGVRVLEDKLGRDRSYLHRQEHTNNFSLFIQLNPADTNDCTRQLDQPGSPWSCRPRGIVPWAPRKREFLAAAQRGTQQHGQSLSRKSPASSNLHSPFLLTSSSIFSFLSA
ncbi:unnamed protein product [Phytophthora lilii]|uniref:Unnamed protein product n=1 Tax=Phytophthora lilii TaxID=2077276 RepID=A0A9W6U5Z3_9STRA|nr:unnamed protein product [Phytophthora lilii]